MKDKAAFIQAIGGLLSYWGGDPPPEAIWAANDLLRWIDKEYGKKCPMEFMEEDLTGQNEQIMNWLNINL